VAPRPPIKRPPFVAPRPPIKRPPFNRPPIKRPPFNRPPIKRPPFLHPPLFPHPRLPIAVRPHPIDLDDERFPFFNDFDFLRPIVFVSPASVIEGDDGTVFLRFRVCLSFSVSHRIGVGFRTDQDTAFAGEDFVPRFGRVFFEPRQVCRTVTIVIVGDQFDEPNQDLFLDLTDATGAVVGGHRATGVILDDDGGPPTRNPFAQRRALELSKQAVMRRGSLLVAGRCAQAAGSCRGVLTVKSAKRKALGGASFFLGAGDTRTIRVPLSSSARKAVARRSVRRVMGTAVVRDQSDSVTVTTRSLLVRAGRAR